MGELQRVWAEHRPHFSELFRRLYRAGWLFVGAFFAGSFLAVPLFQQLRHLLAIPGVQLVATAPFQLIDLAMSTGMALACIVAVPYAVYQLYVFLRPGLTSRERRIVLLHVPGAVVLFALGFVYGAAVLYYAMGALAELNASIGVLNYWDIGRSLSQLGMTAAMLGLVFQLPLVLSVLVRTGLVSVGFLRSHRRHAAVATLILVSLLPPTDGVSLLVMSAPLVVLYEATIYFNSRRGRKS